MTIALSLSRIADEIFAQSALDAAARGHETPAALTLEHRAAIETLIVKLAAETAASLGPVVTATNLGDFDPADDIITIDCDVAQHEATAACLRTNIETAIAFGVLARATAGTDLQLARWYGSLAKTAALPVSPRIVRSA